jgi:hypothetical protein
MKRLSFSFVALAAIFPLCGCVEDLTPPNDLMVVLADGTRVYRVDSGSSVPMRLQLDAGAAVAKGAAGGGGGKDAVVVPPGVASNLPVKAYPIGRYVDPFDPTVMHERHVIFRGEALPRWVLDASSENQIIIGPTVGEGPITLHPAVVGAELATELGNAREAAGIMLRGTQDVLRESAKLAVALDDANTRAETMLGQLKQEQEKRKEAEGRAVAAEAENEKLKAPREYQGDND